MVEELESVGSINIELIIRRCDSILQNAFFGHLL
jgi:hypothetical protein